MLAKVWKKALFIICIIACIYNIMFKLVSRISLEVQVKSVLNPTSLFIQEDNKDNSSNITNKKYNEEKIKK